MSIKQAPGPWHVHTSGKHIVTAGPTTQADTVATLHAPQGTNNACLIAVAPELLHALKALVDIAPVNWDDHDDPEQTAAWENARAVIVRANGTP